MNPLKSRDSVVLTITVIVLLLPLALLGYYMAQKHQWAQDRLAELDGVARAPDDRAEAVPLRLERHALAAALLSAAGLMAACGGCSTMPMAKPWPDSACARHRPAGPAPLMRMSKCMAGQGSGLRAAGF